MGFYIQFLQTDQTQTTLTLLENALRQIDPAYAITIQPEDWYGELFYGADRYGEIEINTPDQDLFIDQIAELKDQLDDLKQSSRDLWKQWPSKWHRVETVLDQTRVIVCVRVLWGGRGTESTLIKLDPLWNWLLNNRQGLVFYDVEGYYDSSGLVL